MNILIKNLAILFVLMLLCSQALAQTNNPLKFSRCSYDDGELVNVDYDILPIDFFP